jgi:hypothetical protein
MELRTGVLPIAAIALLAGGAIYPRLLTYAPSPVVALSAQTADAADRSSAAPAERSTEALDLLSDFFGVETAGREQGDRGNRQDTRA